GPRSARSRPRASRSWASRMSPRRPTTACGRRRGGGSDGGPLPRVSHPPGRCKARSGRVLSRVRSFQLRTLPASLPERLFAAGGHEPHGRRPVSTLLFLDHHEGELQKDSLGVLGKATLLGDDVSALPPGSATAG